MWAPESTCDSFFPFLSQEIPVLRYFIQFEMWLNSLAVSLDLFIKILQMWYCSCCCHFCLAYAAIIQLCQSNDPNVSRLHPNFVQYGQVVSILYTTIVLPVYWPFKCLMNTGTYSSIQQWPHQLVEHSQNRSSRYSWVNFRLDKRNIAAFPRC